MIAVFFHCLIENRERGITIDGTLPIIAELMAVLSESGLAKAATLVMAGCNGCESDAAAIVSLVPRNTEIKNFSGGQSELTTLHWLRSTVLESPDTKYVFYFHAKGSQYPGNETWRRWRRCMTNAVIWNWKTCLADLQSGYDTVGAHWMTNQRFPIVPIGQRYWGGNFWAATTNHIRRLPPLPADSHAARYEAETWIGKSAQAPRTRDYAPHFPMQGCQ